MGPEPRRNLLRWLLGGGLSASLISFLYPAFKFMNPPDIPEAAVNEAPAGKVQDLKPNTGKIVKFGSLPVLLVRTSETEWRAFSGVCTHLNCTVQYKESSHQIWCACHNGLYNLNGQVVSGPPPRPLDQYSVHIRGDEVVVSRKA
jgi:cytochrome b6-f complex iron-sulfur subunit